jgi:hypothetical protein
MGIDEKGTFGPEQLRALQAIFDIIWIDLRADGLASFSGPTDDIEALRTQIAVRVMEHAKTESSDEDIIGKVLKSFGITAAPYIRVRGL